MTEFENSHWSEKEFSEKYLKAVDIFIPERRKMIEVLEFFYTQFFAGQKNNLIIDFGCGDGILTEKLLQIDVTISATLIDASDEMLYKAKKRLKSYKKVSYIKASFQELLENDFNLSQFDLAFSSLAIHHLTMEEKKKLFSFIYSHLKDRGYFLNLDVVLSPSRDLDDWYHELWRTQILEAQKASMVKEDYQYIIDLYRDSPENKPDTLDNQLDALKKVGFKDVDCFYKYGIYTVFGGRK